MMPASQDGSAPPVGFPADIELGRDALAGFDATAKREWLVTNGIGGFAAGTLSLANTRRYHALLFASLRPPVERVAMVAKLEVTALYDGARVQLATNEFGDGTVAPRGFVHLESFRLEGLIPVWTWLIADARLEQRIWMRHGENTTYVQFTQIGGLKNLRLLLEPLCTYRDYHWQWRGEYRFAVDPIQDGVAVHPYEGARPYRLLCAGASVRIDPAAYWNFKHRVEGARGLDDAEDLLRPASFELDLAPGAARAMILTAEIHDPMPAAGALAAEQRRQHGLVDQFDRMHRPATDLDYPHIKRFVLAADQFLVERRDPMGTPLGKTVIAGYPWFSDWGRDTMIALPGLALATGRPGIAASVLRTFAKFVSRGMLPNRFPDAGDVPEYNTADASLWFFVAVHHYVRATGDDAFAAEIYPILKDMLGWHMRGTRFGIGMDPADGLLRAGEPGVQLTWMDAKVGDWVVTPRIGKPVEINALWFNAVCILRDLAADLGQPQDQIEFGALAGRIRASFEPAFWFEAGGYLYDVIDGPDGDPDPSGCRRDASLRPNQIFALSLPHALLDGEKARRVLEICATELWTPVGLRSLSPRDTRYTGHYGGGPVERDGAYHQGTVWTWLLGPFAAAHFRVHRNAAAALDLLRAMPAHLREACVGQVSEIMDADPPFEAHGCFAQAWGVAEVLRAWSEIVRDGRDLSANGNSETTPSGGVFARVNR
jgi:predicted glycogen debranching enzyme